ncbi:MAG: hypothetical protein HOC71_06150 [Candidatus Latescibacteria bacterium]|jgi:hypothetical protein|nr:hypothetical protein [Candidatus Latescibacterota bacterium]
MSQNDIFSSEQDTIEIDGIGLLVQFTRYNPKEPESFLDGIELAEDLLGKDDTIYYTKGTSIDPKRIERLIKLCKTTPGLELSIKIKRSAKFIQNFHHEIKKQMADLYKKRQKNAVSKKLFSNISEDINSFFNDFLSNETNVLSIGKVKYICESLKKGRAELFYHHSFNVALFSVAIASSELYKNNVREDKAKLGEIYKAGLYHNYGALTNIENILKISEDKQLRMYWDENSKEYSSLDKLNFSSEIMDSIRFINEYNMGRKEFINSNEWPATMANVVLVADAFLRKESGLFGARQSAKDITDKLNVQAMGKELNELVVQTLTLELNLEDFFDFYQQLDHLSKVCLYDNSAVPYPLTGYMSPTIYVCKNKVMKCKYLDKAQKAVNLAKTLGVLKQGSYNRCLLLSPKLKIFYEKHYEEIKESVKHK